METEAAKTGSGIVTIAAKFEFHWSILSVSQFTCVNLFYPSLHSQNEVTCILRVDVNVNTYAALPDATMEARAVASSAEVQTRVEYACPAVQVPSLCPGGYRDTWCPGPAMML